MVGNKADIFSNQSAKERFTGIENIHFISAKNNMGIDELKSNLFKSTVTELPSSESVIVTNARHHEALQQVKQSLTDIRAGLDNKISGDLLALDIRRCLHYISEITGDISNEHILDNIFSKFCIGK